MFSRRTVYGDRFCQKRKQDKITGTGPPELDKISAYKKKVSCQDFEDYTTKDNDL